MMSGKTRKYWKPTGLELECFDKKGKIQWSSIEDVEKNLEKLKTCLAQGFISITKETLKKYKSKKSNFGQCLSIRDVGRSP